MRAPADPVPLGLLFASESAANQLVAGIPAAARAARAAAAEARTVLIAVPGGWQPNSLCRAEIARLAPSLEWAAGDSEAVRLSSWITGAELQTVDDPARRARHESPASVTPTDVNALRALARQIVAATGKPSDGIVSRHINRPISQAITRLVLRWSGARPWHATLAAALFGIAMLAALLLGGHAGLLAGAVLFQCASIIDGVDGEIARATFRSSDAGAMADSITDAVTNLGFVGGVSYNLYSTGAQQAALAGAYGCTLLALGSAILALQSRRDGGAFTFDALKTRFSDRPSQIKQWLTWITMRDFYALAACVLILIGWAAPLLYAFAGIASAWFAVLIWVLMRAGKA